MAKFREYYVSKMILKAANKDSKKKKNQFKIWKKKIKRNEEFNNKKKL